MPGKQLVLPGLLEKRKIFFQEPLYKRGKACYNSRAIKSYAPVAQWIEHRIPVPRVGGSSPFRRTKKRKHHPVFPLFACAGRDSKGRPERSEGKKVSGGHFFSPWESPLSFQTHPHIPMHLPAKQIPTRVSAFSLCQECKKGNTPWCFPFLWFIGTGNHSFSSLAILAPLGSSRQSSWVMARSLTAQKP